MSKVTVRKKEQKTTQVRLSDLPSQTLFWTGKNNREFFLRTDSMDEYCDAYLCVLFSGGFPISVVSVSKERLVIPLYNHTLEAIITEE